MRKLMIYMIIILITGCAVPMNKTEIRELQPHPWDNLQINIGQETNNLRFDIIRQSYEEEVDDSTTETKTVDYHPVGFDLGNGLFYDLNKNLSFRLDRLLSINDTDNFIIKEGINIAQKRGLTEKSKIGNNICTKGKGFFGVKYKSCIDRKINDNLIEVFQNKRLCYKIATSGNEIAYTIRKRRRPDCVIKKTGENDYYIYPSRRSKKRYKEKEFILKDGEIMLNDQYLIKKEPSQNTIAIYRKNWMNKKYSILLYRIKQDKNKIFIYDTRFFGAKIEKYGNRMSFYRNNVKWKELERIN